MEYGKFNSAEELLKGYNELEKSFTRKCQQLSELQKQTSGTSEVSPPQINTPNEPEVLPENADGSANLNALTGFEAQNGLTDTRVNEPNAGNGSFGQQGSAAAEKVACAVPADNDASSAASNSQTSENALEQIKQYLDARPEDRELLLKSLFTQTRALPKVMNGGGNVSMALPSRPKTLKEASEMAHNLFKNA